MTARMKELAGEIVRLQAELDREIEQRHRALGWSIKQRIIRFEEGIVAQQRQLRISVSGLLKQASPATILSAPVIYSMIIPLALLDLWASLFQMLCFRAYGIPRVRRADYIALDRGRLAYLNWIEALNCAYCGYGNGVIAYVREISSRTEQYWCPIKHAMRISDPHKRYYEFLEFGDAEGYRARLESFRDGLRDPAGAERAIDAGTRPLP